MSNHATVDTVNFLRLSIAPSIEIVAGEENGGARRALLRDELELRLVLRGAVNVDFGDRGYVAAAGNLLRLPARQMYGLTPGNGDGYSFVAFCLDADALARYGVADSAAHGQFACLRAPAELVAQGLAAQSQLAGPTRSARSGDEALFQMLVDFVDWIGDAPPQPSAPDAATRVAPIRRALSQLHERFLHEITLQELAAVAGLSKFHFVRLFSTAVGTTPHRYQLLLRIACARSLLRLGGEIAQVAQHTGFFDQSHFTACFRDVVGVTPGRYKGRAFLAAPDCLSGIAMASRERESASAVA